MNLNRALLQEHLDRGENIATIKGQDETVTAVAYTDEMVAVKTITGRVYMIAYGSIVALRAEQVSAHA